MAEAAAPGALFHHEREPALDEPEGRRAGARRIGFAHPPGLQRGRVGVVGVPRGIGRLLCCDAVNRGVAVHDGNVFFGTLDGRLISLDAETGKELGGLRNGAFSIRMEAYGVRVLRVE